MKLKFENINIAFKNNIFELGADVVIYNDDLSDKLYAEPLELLEDMTAGWKGRANTAVDALAAAVKAAYQAKEDDSAIMTALQAIAVKYSD